MSKPWEKDWVLRKRIARYVIHAPKVVIEYNSRSPVTKGSSCTQTVIGARAAPIVAP